MKNQLTIAASLIKNKGETRDSVNQVSMMFLFCYPIFRMSVNFIGLFFLLLILQPLHAQTTKEKAISSNRGLELTSDSKAPSAPLYGKVHARIFGVSKYKYNQQIRDLCYADEDAKAMYDLALNLGGDSTTVKLYQNELATLDAIQTAVYGLKYDSTLKKDDLLIFYFAGHGESEVNYDELNFLLIPHDAKKPEQHFTLNNFNYTAVQKKLMELAKERGVHVWVVMDACRDMVQEKKVIDSRYTQRALEIVENYVLFLSCNIGEQSHEHAKCGNGRGIFSYYFQKGLEGAADAGDKDGIISLKELRNYLKDNVEKELFKLYQGKREQNPLIVPFEYQDNKLNLATAPRQKVNDNPKASCVHVPLADNSGRSVNSLAAPSDTSKNRFDTIEEKVLHYYQHTWNDTLNEDQLMVRNKIADEVLALLKQETVRFSLHYIKLLDVLLSRVQEMSNQFLGGDLDSVQYRNLLRLNLYRQLSQAIVVLTDSSAYFNNVKEAVALGKLGSLGQIVANESYFSKGAYNRYDTAFVMGVINQSLLDNESQKRWSYDEVSLKKAEFERYLNESAAELFFIENLDYRYLFENPNFYRQFTNAIPELVDWYKDAGKLERAQNLTLSDVKYLETNLKSNDPFLSARIEEYKRIETWSENYEQKYSKHDTSRPPLNTTSDFSCIDIDGNEYKTVKIGNQVWMAENLRTTKYNDGSVIPNITDRTAWTILTTPAWCKYRNIPSYEITYGKLYNWFTVAAGNMCPTGWHVPTDAEWKILTDFLGDESVGGKMKSVTGWEPPNTGATNESGFSGLPGGARNYKNGAFSNVGNNGYWWSSSESSTKTAWIRGLQYDHGSVYITNFYKQSGLSVRCLRDEPR